MAWKRFQIGFDVHGAQQDSKANEVFFKFAESWKPDYRVCGGDVFDFVPLRKGASEDERRESMIDDFAAGKRWLERFKATDYIRGNHCERLWDLAQHGTGALKDYALSGVAEVDKLMKSLRCKMLPYDRRSGVLRLGRLKALHGYASGPTAARRMCQTYGSCVFGHGHGIQTSSIEGIENRMAWMGGCLCSLDMPYTRAQLGSLVWRLGFPYGVINDKTGDFHLWQGSESNGVWMLPSDIVQL